MGDMVTIVRTEQRMFPGTVFVWFETHMEDWQALNNGLEITVPKSVLFEIELRYGKDAVVTVVVKDRKTNVKSRIEET
jgi:hypothetical protein